MKMLIAFLLLAMPAMGQGVTTTYDADTILYMMSIVCGIITVAM